jgi:hypothetical protein
MYALLKKCVFLLHGCSIVPDERNKIRKFFFLSFSDKQKVSHERQLASTIDPFRDASVAKSIVV